MSTAEQDYLCQHAFFSASVTLYRLDLCVKFSAFFLHS